MENKFSQSPEVSSVFTSPNTFLKFKIQSLFGDLRQTINCDPLRNKNLITYFQNKNA